MSDLSPMLHQEQSNAPMLGGDKRPVPCPHCREQMFRDLLGKYLCWNCTVHEQQRRDLEASAVCPKCGDPECLHVELNSSSKVVYIFCDQCAQPIWIAKNYNADDVYWTGYLAPGYIDAIDVVQIPIDDGPASIYDVD